MEDLPLEAWMEVTGSRRSVCVPAQPAAPAARAAPAHLLPIPVLRDNGEELRAFTQQYKLCLVHVAVKMQVLMDFILGLMRGIV